MTSCSVWKSARPRQLWQTELVEDLFVKESGGEDDDETGPRFSTKRSFLAKLQLALLGYSSNDELLQFVYDLNLWTALGSKKNLQTGVPMRVLMTGHSFSPLYWRRVHNGPVDLVRQIGFPTIFFTMAPFEWAAP